MICRRVALGILVGGLIPIVGRAGPFASFAEPGYPWLASVVDATEADVANRGTNLTVRGIVLRTGGVHACFDTDLLRISAVWKGQPDGRFLEMNGVATMSYQEPFDKAGGGQDKLPKILGEFLFGNAVEPGWIVAGAGGALDFRDPRPPGADPDEPGRGPLPPGAGRFEGIRMTADYPYCQLEYTVAGTLVREQIRSGHTGGRGGAEFLARHISLAPHDSTLALVLTNTPGVHHSLIQGDGSENVSSALVDGRRILTFPPCRVPADCVVRLATSAVIEFESPAPAEFFSRPSERRWKKSVSTRGSLSPDTKSPYVIDELPLPDPNPWSRNVRVSGIDFFKDGRAALVTFDGDVWILSGIDHALENLTWTRFASGLNEPQSVRIRDGEVFVFDKTGLLCLNDTNGDGEADFYANFCNAFSQTAEMREFPMDSVLKPDGGFFLCKGGQVGGRHGLQNGTVIEISVDGRSARTFATGLRQAYLGIHPETGMLTASDQQGHFVPSTPVHWIREGRYYGFAQALAEPDKAPAITPPLCWVPHEVYQSGSGHIWIGGDRFGPLSGALISLAFSQPGAFRVYLDTDGDPPQAAVIPLDWPLEIPVLKAAVNPVDGQLYAVGFQIWGSSSDRVGGLQRVRYNPGVDPDLPSEVRVTDEGVLFRFPFELESDADPLDFFARQWNYQRSPGYGSGHYRLDGSPGEEVVQIAGVHFSADRRSAFARMAALKPSMQLSVSYGFQTRDGRKFSNTTYLTPHRLDPFDAAWEGFDPLPEIDEAALGAVRARAEEAPTAEYGRRLALQYGCLACHSTDGTMERKKGPSWMNLAGSERELVTGDKVVADREYLIESILDPTASFSVGFKDSETGMPPYRGILTPPQLEALLLYFAELSKGAE